jgi:hypothetical protein
MTSSTRARKVAPLLDQFGVRTTLVPAAPLEARAQAAPTESGVPPGAGNSVPAGRFSAFLLLVNPEYAKGVLARANALKLPVRRICPMSDVVVDDTGADELLGPETTLGMKEYLAAARK